MTHRIFFYSLVLLISLCFSLSNTTYGKEFGDDEKLIRVGTGAYTDGFYDIAEKHFLQFLQEYPEHSRWPEITYLLAKSFYYREKLRESRTQFLKILTESKTFEYIDYVYFWLAFIEIKLGNNEVARRYFISILNRYPKFEFLDQVYYHLALIELGSKRFLPAESYLKKVPSVTKNRELTLSSFFWLGILYYQLDRMEEATHFIRLVQQEPKTLQEPLSQYTLLWLGELQLRQGKFIDAKRAYLTFLEQYQENAFTQEVRWKLGLCDYRLGHDKEAIELFQSFKTQYKDSPLLLYVYYLLGGIYLRQNDPVSSLKELSWILSRSRENPIWGITLIALFWNHLQQNDFSGAQKVFQRLQKLNHFEEEKAILQWVNAEITFFVGKISDSLPYYFNILNTSYREKALFKIGKGYFFEGQLREAITNLDILLLEFPNSEHLEESLFIKGECFAQVGAWRQALDTYGLLIQKGKQPNWKLFAAIQTGNIYLFLKDLIGAEKAFKEVLDLFPDHPLSTHAAFQLGKIYFKQNNFLESIHYYSMILKGGRLEWLGGTYFSLGEIFYQQGKYDKAINNFEMALRYLQESSPWFFLTHLEIGNLQRKNGRYEEARRSYLTILQQAKDEDLKRAATDLLRLIEPK